MTEDGRMRAGIEDNGHAQARPPTAQLAVVGASIFVSGFFLLGVARREFAVEVYVLVLLGAVLVALPLLASTWLVAWSEAVTGPAWANGLRRLDTADRSAAGIRSRGLRYAGFLWLANGGALWLAALLGSA